MTSVTVALSGGIGNQLFQVSAGLQVAMDRHSILHLDLNWFSLIKHTETSREFALDKLGTLSSKYIVEQSECLLNDGKTFSATPFRLSSNLGIQSSSLSSSAKITEKTYYRIPSLPSSASIDMSGYWQKLFYQKNSVKHIAELLPQQALCRCQEILLSSCPSHSKVTVSLHIRRGDYAQNSLFSSVKHHVLPLEYYVRAIDIVSAAYSDEIVLYIFSDDLGFVESKLLPLVKCSYVVVSRLGLCDVDELLLMASCSSHIIANSTFSWWAARLSPFISKSVTSLPAVIAPKTWFDRPSRLNSAESLLSLLPLDWMVV